MTPYKKAICAHTMQSVSVIVLFVLIILLSSGCASSARVMPDNSGDVAGNGAARVVRPGDHADIRFLCRLRTGEIVAATDSPPTDQPRSNIFVLRKETDAPTITAIDPDAPAVATREEPFEVEILNQLSNKVAGMKVGENRRVEVTAEDIPTRDIKNYTVQVVRVRTRAKEMKIKADEYFKRTNSNPEVGQAFTMDPAFPGRVEAVTDGDVVIRFNAIPGDAIETPFGPGRVRDEGPNYKVDIDARKGGLTRIGAMIGRITDVDDKFITIDYRNPFGHETLVCDVTIEKISDEKTTESGTGK